MDKNMYLRPFEEGVEDMKAEAEAEGMRNLMETMLASYASTMKRYVSVDAKIERLYEEGKEPSKKEETEFEKLKDDYLDFMNFFRKFDGNYWSSEMSLLDVVAIVNSKVGFSV